MAAGWAEECADAAEPGEGGGGGPSGASVRCRAQAGSLATHVYEAHELLLPCLKYTALSDVL